jgi:hypothetical protein
MTLTPTPTPTPQPEQQAAVKTWKPTTAGILTLIAGVLNVIAGIVVAALSGFIGSMMWWMPRWMGFGAIGAALIVIGIVSIIGGIFALQRRTWGRALAGAICALLSPPVIILGILAIIFISLSKKEFV